jgi:hypothetical protein
MAHVVGRFDLRGKDGINKEAMKQQANGTLLMEFAGKKNDELRDHKLRVERYVILFS